MNLTGTNARVEMVATANSDSVNVVGGVSIGSQISAVAYTTAPDIAYSLRLQISDGFSLTWDTITGAITGGDAGVAQVTTQTIVGTITTAGIALCTFTSALTGTIVVNVTAQLGFTGADLGTDFVDALAENETISRYWIISGVGDQVVATAREKRTNDPSLNIGYTNGTAAGLTEDATSVPTTAGVMETKAFRLNGQDWDQTDFQGAPLPAAGTGLVSTLIAGISGTGLMEAVDTSANKKCTIITGSYDASFFPFAVHPWSTTDVEFEAVAGDITITLDVHANE